MGLALGMATEEDVRRLALALPDTAEQPSYGTPGFRVHDRLFARILEDPAVLVLWRGSEEEKLELIAADPVTFFSTTHYDGGPLLLVRLRRTSDGELDELLRESWLVRAPAKLRARLDT